MNNNINLNEKLNSEEIKKLYDSTLSLQAKIIYILGILPFLRGDKTTLDYHKYQDALRITKYNKITFKNEIIYNPDIGIINLYVIELIKANLITPLSEPKMEDYYDNIEILLPLRKVDQCIEASKIFKISKTWLPSAQYEQIARLSGLMNSSYTQEQVNKFIIYFEDKDIVKNAHQWDLSFIRFLKKDKGIKH